MKPIEEIAERIKDVLMDNYCLSEDSYYTKTYIAEILREELNPSPPSGDMEASPIEIVKDIADGMIGIGGIPSNEEFYAEFNSRVQERLGVAPFNARAKWIPRRFEITFPGILQAIADINNNAPYFTAAFDYYGSPVNVEDIQVYEQPLPEPPK